MEAVRELMVAEASAVTAAAEAGAGAGSRPGDERAAPLNEARCRAAASYLLIPSASLTSTLARQKREHVKWRALGKSSSPC